MRWLLARLRCWRRGYHDMRLLTTDFRYAACLDCAKQLVNQDIPGQTMAAAFASAEGK